MARLSTTILDLSRMRKRFDGLKRSLSDLPNMASGSPSAGHLRPVEDFGSNPGKLRMLTFVPDRLPPSPALVVVLHGCGQTAADYDLGAGWSTLAERLGFVLVFPEQSSANNPKSCFNWFLPGDVARGRGEAMSIRQMVERAALDHGVDRSRIFVTGLSAGGAMAVAMLAAYPDVFAGGGIVAGLPYGSASNVQEALRAMFQTGVRPPHEWGDLVRSASRHHGPWPRLSVWHGGADDVVKPVNAEELIKQWTNLHNLPLAPTRRESVGHHPREVWCDDAGREVIESFTIGGMGHGAPIHVGSEDHMAGAAGAFLLDVGISSSYHIARFWGLAGEARVVASAASAPLPRSGQEVALVAADGTVEIPSDGMPAGQKRTTDARPRGGEQLPPTDVGQIIESALRAAGLMKR